MWVWPFTLIGCVVAFIFFVMACIISVGFRTFCDSYVDSNDRVTSCADVQKAKWIDDNYDSSTSYDYIHASEIASWLMFLVWMFQVSLGILRIIRNRRLRVQGTYNDLPGENPSGVASVVAAKPLPTKY